MSLTQSRFGLFSSSGAKPIAFRHLPTDNPALLEIDDFVEAHCQRLIQKADPIQRAKLLRSLHQIKPLTTENYLRQFIKDFEHEPSYEKTVTLYRKKLNEYVLAKNQAEEASLTASHQMTEAPKLTAEELDWQRLLETLKRCVNNRSTRDALSWHPRHHENYYLAKLRIQWQRFESKYRPILVDNLAETLAIEIAEERRQTVIEKHVEAQRILMQHQAEYSPTRLANQQVKLEHTKREDLNEIDMLASAFVKYTQESIAFAKQAADQTVMQVFDQAVLEIQRQERTIASHPAIFNLTLGARQKNHALATLARMDETREMQIFRAIFEAQSATIAAKLKNHIVFD